MSAKLADKWLQWSSRNNFRVDNDVLDRWLRGRSAASARRILTALRIPRDFWQWLYDDANASCWPGPRAVSFTLPMENRISDEDDMIMILDGAPELRAVADRENRRYDYFREACERIEARQ